MNVELIDIYKTFGAVHANVSISMKIPSGTIQGILGENGAGKSTLMKILSGFIRPDSGQILLDGQPVSNSFTRRMPSGRAWVCSTRIRSIFLRCVVIENFTLGRSRAVSYPSRDQALSHP
jgi:ABC-type uncharacterized transport system ATPase subunit